MNKLKFDWYIHSDMYNLYNSQIEEFSESQKEFLQRSFDDYRADRRILKAFRLKMKQESYSPPVNVEWIRRSPCEMELPRWRKLLRREYDESGISWAAHMYRNLSKNCHYNATMSNSRNYKRSLSQPRAVL